MKKERLLIDLSLGICIILLCVQAIVLNVRFKNLNKKTKDLNAQNEALVTEIQELREENNILTENIESLTKESKDIKTQLDELAAYLVEKEKKEEVQDVKEAEPDTSAKAETKQEYKEEYHEPATEEVISTDTDADRDYSYDGDIPWVVYEVVECEVHGGDKLSKMHVAHVIRNRVWSDQFPNNYYDVCTAPYQFCMRSDVEQSTIDAVNEAMQIADTTYGALFFHSMEWMAEWGGYSWKFTDDVGHHFY